MYLSLRPVLLVHLAFGFFLYLTFIFWDGLTEYAVPFYILLSIFASYKESTWLLIPFTLMNLFNCTVVITHAARAEYNIPLALFFEPEYTEASVVLDELNGISSAFLIWVALPVLLVYSVIRLLKLYNKNK